MEPEAGAMIVVAIIVLIVQSVIYYGGLTIGVLLVLFIIYQIIKMRGQKKKIEISMQRYD